MLGEFRLWPRAASTVAEKVDTLYLFEVAVTVFFTILICALVIGMGVIYRKGSRAARANPPTSKWLEAIWATVPLVLVMVMFAWGAAVFYEIKTVPDGAMKIDVVGKQWMWKLQHANGKREINELHVPVGRPVVLRMISDDVIHDFYVPAFRVKQDVVPGRYSQLWFEATEPGTYHLFCAEYCGTEHAQMIGKVVVMEERAFAEWLSGTSSDDPPAVAGEKLFERMRCGTCHKQGPGGRGPSLVGIAGKPVPLKGGGSVLADANYIRESIVRPQARIVAGYQPLMPAYPQLTTEELNQLVAYIESLGAPGDGDAGRSDTGPSTPVEDATPPDENEAPSTEGENE